MSRIYRVRTGWQTVSAIQDLMELIAPSTGCIRVHAIYVSQSSDAGDTESEQLQCSVKHATGAYTSGSGGASITIDTPVGEAAPEMTAERNNTTQAVAGSGTLQVIHDEAVNVMAGLYYKPLPIEIIDIAPTDALIISLNVAPADALTMAAIAVVEEIGGV